MCSTRANIFIILLSIVTPRYISCACRQSYTTTCDSLQDIKANQPDMENWTELIVGSEESPESDFTSIDLMTFDYNKFQQLRTLTIVRQLKEIEVRNYALTCTYNTFLEEFTLYGNNIQQLKAHSFPNMMLRKMSLINNNIEVIEAYAFFGHSIEILDLSHNKIEVIEYAALSRLRNTKVINLNNNILTHIDANSFKHTLQVLNLDNNKLSQIQNDVLNLPNLVQLSVKNNKLLWVPEVKQLKKIKLLDFSNNHIQQIKADAFDQLGELQILELSNNRFEEVPFLGALLTQVRKQNITVSLAFNHLKEINFENVTLGKHVFVLIGNPWDCKGWNEMLKVVAKFQGKCDLRFFNSGKVPYCLNYNEFSHYYADRQRKMDIDSFIRKIKDSAKLIHCELKVDKAPVLSRSFAVGCVA